ncbi:FecR domain-containing protein [Halomonas sp. SH5A2]|uniref:FecR family protein n=1 Tax=Halomonas sp. SH5A2 TaxID=2749040 RepID=UPI0016422F12|nr:FecR domain-containing protein [Halomonas sp. SH5A2]QNI01948.1 FecR domain-containing protein [Halomonas sp. SH5A2]
MARFTQHPLARWVSLHATVGSLVIPMVVWANAPAGKVMFIHGDASIERDGERTAAERGEDIFAGDTFRTQSASTLQIRYSDGGTKAIQPESTYTLESYNKNEENPEESEQSGELVRGGLRAVTGLIGRNAPENVSHKTPVATMGIRGTSFQLVHVPEGEKPPIPGMATGSYLYVESGMLSMSTDAGERIVRPGQVVFSAAADATPEFLTDGLAIFEQLEEQRREQTRQDDENPSDETAQQDGNNTTVTSTTLDADTDSNATDGTFFDRIALAPATNEQLQSEQTNNLTQEQSTRARAFADNLEDDVNQESEPETELEPEPEPEPEPDPEPEPEPDPEPEPEPDPEPEPEAWIDFPPTTENSLTTLFGSDFLNGFYEENTTPTEQDSQNIAGGEVVWGYWDAGAPDPYFEGDTVMESIPFIASSDELTDTLSFDLSEQALSAISDQLAEGVTFNWAGGTGLVNQAGDDVINILGDSTITLASTGMESSVTVDIVLEDSGQLVGGLVAEEGSASFETFPIDTIDLTHENCEPDCFDGFNTLQGQYIGEEAAAIMSLIEASGDLGNYSGTGLFER